MLHAGRPLALPVLLALLALAISLGGCGSSSAPTVASFTREWDDGRLETLELYGDGRVLMNHSGTIERLTLPAGDLERLTASLGSVTRAADPAAYPRLTLTPAGGSPVVVDPAQGTAGELFLWLLERHRLP